MVRFAVVAAGLQLPVMRVHRTALAGIGRIVNAVYLGNVLIAVDSPGAITAFARLLSMMPCEILFLYCSDIIGRVIEIA